MSSQQTKDKSVRVRNTPPFKLKDKNERFFQILDLKKQFGFVPEILVIEKLRGQNNTFFLRAILTKEEIEKENKIAVTKSKVAS